ncbi:hypothetical protein [Streptomyces sp. NPDC020298]|uniref:hypothetical protein n=1 Tax=unclassified Streptomyces TaxID=2593676 RepID=UPI0033DF8CB0
MTIPTVLAALADQLDTQPNRPVDLPTIRGKARALGLPGDWLTLLPNPAGAHHSEYATRLRTLAGDH